jgi:hypothetical protein
MVFLLMKSLVSERIHPTIPIQWNSYERHWALTKVIIQTTIFQVMVPCNLVDMYGCFRLQILHQSPSQGWHIFTKLQEPHHSVKTLQTLKNK